MARGRGRSVVDGVVVDRQAASGSAKLGAVGGTFGRAIRLCRLESRGIESVTTIALPSIFCAEEVVGGTESGARLQSHGIRGGVLR